MSIPDVQADSIGFEYLEIGLPIMRQPHGVELGAQLDRRLPFLAIFAVGNITSEGSATPAMPFCVAPATTFACCCAGCGFFTP